MKLSPALLMIFFLLYASNLSGQSFELFDIDRDNLPIVSGKFYAIDENGKQLHNISKQDIDIKENGVGRDITFVSCPSKKHPEALSAVLTIDVSGSMRGNNLKYAQEAAKAWINALPLGKSECALTSFDGSNYFNRDFTTSRDKLLSAVEGLHAMGSTSFNAGFLDERAGALLAAEEGKYKKVIIFLTDGSSSGDEQEIIQKANEIGATVFCVTLGYKCPLILKNISEKTGGMWFENINSGEEAKSTYLQILNIAQGSGPCEIEWESEINCLKVKNYEAFCKPVNSRSSGSYIVKDEYVAKLELEPGSLRFGKVPPGETQEITVELTAKNSYFEIFDIIPDNPNFDVTPKAFTLNKGQSKEITVKYSPSDSSYNFVRFEIQSSPCDNVFYATSGYLGNISEYKDLNLIHPNGGEEFLAGNDTIIQWEGVLPDDTVSLDYSYDKGATWNHITDSASGLSYKWENIPLPASKECLMKVTFASQKGSNLTYKGHSHYVNDLDWSPDGTRIATVSLDSTLQIWDSNNGTKLLEINKYYEKLKSVAWSPDGRKIATVGQDTIVRVWNAETGKEITNFKGIESLDKSLEWSPDGSMLALCGGSGKVWNLQTETVITNFDFFNGVIRDIEWSPDGSKFAISSNEGVIIILNGVNFDIKNKINVFDHESWINGISWDPGSNKIVSVGFRMIISDAQSGEVLVNKNVDDALYSVDWSPDGTRIATIGYDGILSIREANELIELESIPAHSSSGNEVEWSPGGRKVATASTDNTAKVWNLVPLNDHSDVSDSLWSIVRPELQAGFIDMGKVQINNSKDSVITGFLKNPNDHACRVDSIFISGEDAGQFKQMTGFTPFSIEPGESKNIEFRFSPNSVGTKNSDITIYYHADKLSTKITGEGVKPVLDVYSDILDFGVIEIFDNKIRTKILLENISTETVKIDSTVVLGPDTSQFEILSGGGSFDLAPEEGRELEIRFAPRRIGRTRSTISFYYNNAGSLAIAQLFGAGTGGVIVVSRDTAYAGMKRVLTVGLEGDKLRRFAEVISSYSMTLRFEKTILTPLDNNLIDEIKNDSIYIKINGKVNKENDHIAEIPVIAALGRVEETDIILDEVMWFKDKNDTIVYDTEIYDGYFKLLGICHEGGARLLNPGTKAGIMNISPNPAENDLEISFALIEKGYTKAILYNTLGQNVRELFSEVITGKDTKRVNVDISDIGKGVYFIVLKTPTIYQSRKFIIK